MWDHPDTIPAKPEFGNYFLQIDRTFFLVITDNKECFRNQNKNGVLRYLFPRKWQYCVGESVYRDPFLKTPVYGNYLTNQSYIMEQSYSLNESYTLMDDGGNSFAYPVIELLERGLYYVPQFTSNADLYDYQFQCDLLPLLKKYQEIAFIDTQRENTISSHIKTLLLIPG